MKAKHIMTESYTAAIDKGAGCGLTDCQGNPEKIDAIEQHIFLLSKVFS